MRLFRLILGVLCLLTLAPAAPAAAAPLCFPQTGQCIDGRFREYWEQNGGLPVFGYPISPATSELNRDTEKYYLTQWFERNRFELHPQNARPYDVLLGRLGDERLVQQGRDWAAFPKGSARSGCDFFAETGHTLCEPFRSYWKSHGLEFDGRAGYSYAESLALFGLPLSEPQMETNTSGHTVSTQWFERARFEHHPNNPAEYRVLLGLLGNEVRAAAPGGMSPEASRVIELTNQQRAASGMPPVRAHTLLNNAALAHSNDMADRDFVSHTGSNGSQPGDRITAAGYHWSTYGENVAGGYSTPEAAMDAWMNSPGHRANILNPEFTEIGVALVYRSDRSYKWYWTMVLARR